MATHSGQQGLRFSYSISIFFQVIRISTDVKHLKVNRMCLPLLSRSVVFCAQLPVAGVNQQCFIET